MLVSFSFLQITFIADIFHSSFKLFVYCQFEHVS